MLNRFPLPHHLQGVTKSSLKIDFFFKKDTKMKTLKLLEAVAQRCSIKKVFLEIS